MVGTFEELQNSVHVCIASSNSINTVWYIKIDAEFFNKFHEMNEKGDLVRFEARFFNHTLAEYVCTRRRFKVNRVENEILYRYIYTKKKKEIIILSFRLVMKNYTALYFYMLFIARIELLNIKFKNKLNLDFFLRVIFVIMLFLSFIIKKIFTLSWLKMLFFKGIVIFSLLIEHGIQKQTKRSR